MGIVDIIIIAVLAAFAMLGFKRGVFQSLVAVVGFIAVVYIAYLLKNILVIPLFLFKFTISFHSNSTHFSFV